MSVNDIFNTYADCTAALLKAFPQAGAALYARETLNQYECTQEISLVFLEASLPGLLKVLLPAHFQTELHVRVYDLDVRLHYSIQEPAIIAIPDSVDIFDVGGSLPSQAVDAYEDWKACVSTRGMPLAEILQSLKALEQAGVSPELNLQFFLDKQSITRWLDEVIKVCDSVKTVPFLFPEAFLASLERLSLVGFEEGFCQAGKRSLIPIFSYSGWMQNDLLAIYGAGHTAEFEAALTQPISTDTKNRQEKTLALRKSQEIWLNPILWLTPQFFELDGDLTGEPGNVGSSIHRQLESFQALLAALYLADIVELEGDGYIVEYHGFGRGPLYVRRPDMVNYGDLHPLVDLYTYAYEGFSTDKLEIVQQYLSLVATSPKDLVTKAESVRRAAKNSYDLTLKKKVADYFETRNKVQERIKTAVSETVERATNLSRTVNDDVFKIGGLIAAAVIGAFLKPDISLWAMFGVALVISLYTTLVLYSYLRTLQRTYNLSIEQYQSSIRSYADLLTEEEIEGYLKDEQVERAGDLFASNQKQASLIYRSILLLALAGAVIAFVLVLSAA
jgi:hypothetical protein